VHRFSERNGAQPPLLVELKPVDSSLDDFEQRTYWLEVKERRQVILDAQQHGYQLGEHCQGGAYAVSMPAIDAIAARGWLDCRLWLGTYVAEDSVVSLWVKALGFDALGMSNPGEPFAIRHIGLPRPAEELVRLGFGIAHSIKDHDGATEDELRAYFRKVRESAAT
jgi:hypothetical protein